VTRSNSLAVKVSYVYLSSVDTFNNSTWYSI